MVTVNAPISGFQNDFRIVLKINYTNDTYTVNAIATSLGEFTYGNDNDDNEAEVAASEVDLGFTIDAPTHTAIRTIINLLTVYDTDAEIYRTPSGQAEHLYFKGTVDRQSIEYDFKTKEVKLKALDDIHAFKARDITTNDPWGFNLYSGSGFLNIHYPAHYFIRTLATNNRLADGFYRTLLTDSSIALRTAGLVSGVYKYGTLAGLNNSLGDPVEWYIALRNTYYFNVYGDKPEDISGFCPKTVSKTLKSIAANLCCTVIPYTRGRIYFQQRFPNKPKVAGSTLISEGVILDAVVRIVPAKKGVHIKALKAYFNSSGSVYDIDEDKALSIDQRGTYEGNEIETVEILYPRASFTSGTVSVAGMHIVGYEQEQGTDVRTLTAYPILADYVELLGETTYYSSIVDLFYRKVWSELRLTRFIYELELAGTDYDIDTYYRLPYDTTRVYRVRKISFDFIKNTTKLSLVEFTGVRYTVTEEEPADPTVDTIIMTEHL